MERDRHQIPPGSVARRTFLKFFWAGAAGVAAGALGEHTVHDVLTQPDKSFIPDRIADITQADGYRYNVTDNKGVGMDHLKIEDTGQGKYVGVYHHEIHGVFHTRFATSTDLLVWEYKGDIEKDSSQAYIRRTDSGGYIVCYEKHNAEEGNHIKVRYYENLQAILTSKPSKEVNIKKTLTNTGASEGTPTIISIEEPFDMNTSTIQIAFHVNDGTRDLPAVGDITGFQRWQAVRNTNLISQFDTMGVSGNIGQRDDFAYNGNFFIIEAEDENGAFGTFHLFLYDKSSTTLKYLDLHTHQGSRAFANPTFTELNLPNGKRGIVVTVFVPTQGAVQGEAGELVYFFAY